MAGLPQKPIILSKNGILLILEGHEKNFSEKFSEKSIFSTFGDAVFQNLHFEYASYGIKRCAEQFPTHNTMFLSYWGVKMCVRKLFASTFHQQCVGVFSEFFEDFLNTFTPPTEGTFHCTFLPLEIFKSITDMKKLRELSKYASENPESTLEPNIRPEFFRSFLEVF